MVVSLDISHDDKSPLNDVASRNISSMEITLDVIHDDKSPLNDSAP